MWCHRCNTHKTDEPCPLGNEPLMADPEDEPDEDNATGFEHLWRELDSTRRRWNESRTMAFRPFGYHREARA